MSETSPSRSRKQRRIRFVLGSIGIGFLVLAFSFVWNEFGEKRVAIVVPERIVRGAWQRPSPLRRVIRREGIRTLMTLTAINRNDPKYLEQEEVVKGEGVAWIIVPMRGSTATPEQMAMASDIATDPRYQPLFFHCVAGHHRSNLVQAAIRIRHQGWSGAEAWAELAALSWTRPEAEPDSEDRVLIDRFALAQSSIPRVQPDQILEFMHATSR